MFPADFFESRTQRKILRVLAEKNKKYTLDEIAEMCNRSKSSISRALKNSQRYPFIEKKRVPGSKQLVFGLNSDSRYTEAIKTFFNEERNRERKNGTVPVDIWNLLEDLTHRLSNRIEGFVELFLFGSYATGDYHSKSDIDLILLHTSGEDVSEGVQSTVKEIDDERMDLFTVDVEPSKLERIEDGEILDLVKEKGPLRKEDTLIPLSGEVTK